MRCFSNAYWSLFLLVLLITCNGCTKRHSRKGPTSKARCFFRLQDLREQAIRYAQEHEGWFPVAEGKNMRAHDSFQLLMEAMGRTVHPDCFVCPSSDQMFAQEDGNGRFILTEQNISYAWRAKPFNMEDIQDKVVIACDKYCNHQWRQSKVLGINIIYSDGSCQFIKEDDLGPGGVDAFLKKHDLTR